MRPCVVLIAASVSLLSAIAFADDAGEDAAFAVELVGSEEEEDAPEEARYPLRYISRPLTLANNMVRLDGALRLDHTTQVDGALVLGGAISFAKVVEFGISPHRLGSLTGTSVEGALPIVFFDDVDLGSLPIYLRLRLAELDEIDFALDAGTSIPLESSPNVTAFGAVLVRARLAKRLILDTGVEIRVLFDDDDEVFTLVVPGIFSVQIVDAIYLGFRTGISWPEFKSSRLGIPLGLEGGYSLGNERDNPIADLVALFEWPSIVVPGANSDQWRENIWVLSFGVRFYIPFASP